jgi:ATP-dependent Lon protease
VSGIKEKIAAAYRAGIYKFVLPSQNKKDLKEVTKELRDQMEFIFIDRTDQLFEIALLDRVEPPKTLEHLIQLETQRRSSQRKAVKRVASKKRAARAKKKQ